MLVDFLYLRKHIKAINKSQNNESRKFLLIKLINFHVTEQLEIIKHLLRTEG